MAITAAFLVSLMSFVGIILLFGKFSKSYVLTALISFAAGSLLGDAFFHLIPEQVAANGYNNTLVFGILAGIVMMLLVEAYLHCSHDDSGEADVHDVTHIHSHAGHDHSALGKITTIGDSIHNFLDGVAIGASFLISPQIGIASTIAIILHEIPNEFAHVSVFIYSGWNKKKVLTVNFLTALISILGVISVYALNKVDNSFTKVLAPIAAGQFIYIALADLLPVIHKKAGGKKYLIEITAFIIGILIMYLLTLVG